MSRAVARLGSPSDHGGAVVSASTKTFAERIGVARAGDLHACPIPGHGRTPIVSASSKAFADGRALARVGDAAACGAVITAGSVTVAGSP